MPVLPNQRLDLVQFCEAHWPVWNTAPAPTSIGLTSAQVLAFKAATENARAKFTGQQSAKEAAKAATTAWHGATDSLRTNAADLVRVIKSYAEQQADPMAVYAAAQIPPPAAPSPAPPPGKPTDIVITLNPEGSLTFKWKAENAASSSGAYFAVRRQIGDSGGEFMLIGNTGGKTFTDDTLPFGTDSATYLIQGFRGTTPGEQSDLVTVRFGVGGGGGFSVTGATAGAGDSGGGALTMAA